jgi:hypothetical protein
MATTPPPGQPGFGDFETPPPQGPPPGGPPAGGPPPGAPPLQPLPWEQPGYPVLEALYETAKLVLTRPTEAFTRMSTTGDLGRPLVYAVVFGWIGILASQIYQLALRGAMWQFLPRMPGSRAMVLPVTFNIAFMIIAPVLVLLGVFIGAAILHLFLMIVGGANRDFATTVRVLCYAGTTQILQVVPFCGGIIASIWAIVLDIIGLAQAHRTTQGKAALAVLLPVALCCVCVAIVFAVAGAGIMAALGRMR